MEITCRRMKLDPYPYPCSSRIKKKKKARHEFEASLDSIVSSRIARVT